MREGIVRPLENLDKISEMLKLEANGTSDFNDALVCAKLLGRLHWENISNLFCDDEFEKKMFDKWKLYLARTNPILAAKKNNGKWCHIISTTFAIGGHTRLFKELIQGIAALKIKQSVIITQKDKAKFRKTNLDHGINVYLLSGNLAKRSIELYEKAVGHDVVVLHIHPNDIGAALVARKLRTEGTKVLFINHADHAFSFGTGASDAVMEISATGWKITEAFRKVRSQNFLGIPFIPHNKSNGITIANTTGPILSVGGSSKFRPKDDLNFAKFLQNLMEIVPNRVVLIGPNKKEPWWNNLLSKYPDRISIMGIQSPETVKTEYQNASCYIDSFPIDGGTAFSEAVMSGLPCFGLNKAAASGASPADSLRCNGMETLTEEVSEFLKTGIQQRNINLIKKEIKERFTTEAVVERLFQASLGQGEPLPEDLYHLGTRGVDYFSNTESVAFKLKISKKSWNMLSFSIRISMLSDLWTMDLDPSISKLLRRRIIFGL